MEYFNEYAFCFVAIYGYNFIDSSKAAISLFYDRGWNAVMNDDILAYVFFLAKLFVGIICTLFTFIYISSKNISSVNGTLLMILGYNIGHFMCTVTTNLISSAVATIFICFAEKPDYFRITHPELFNELLDAWKDFYPDMTISEEMIAGGTYVPPHLILKDTQAIAYQPIFAGYKEGREGSDELETPRSMNRPKSTLKKGVVISGKFAESPYSSPRANTSEQTIPGTSAVLSSDGIISKTMTGVREQSTKIYEQLTTYINRPQYRRDHHFLRSEIEVSHPPASRNIQEEHPQIYDNIDESTMF